MATHGMVASSQPLASNIGLDVLKAGGNAIDAAVAVAAALAVTEPCSTGLGGDCFLLFYDAKTRKVQALNGSGRCASAMTLKLAHRVAIPKKQPGSPRKDDKTFPPFHALTVTVPGAAQGWCDAVERWGSRRFSLGQLLEPAAVLAAEGFPVAPITAHFWAAGEAQLRNSENFREMMVMEEKDGSYRAPRAAEVIRRPGLAEALRRLGHEGRKGFYEGPVAESIVNEVHAHDGLLSLEDLKLHESTFPEPISTVFRGVRLHEVPPNGQGIAALIALNLLQATELYQGLVLRKDTMGSLPTLHAVIECLRLAFADTRAFVGDPAYRRPPSLDKEQPETLPETTEPKTVPSPDGMLSNAYATSRVRSQFNPNRANVDVEAGSPESSSCTVSFQVVDGEGNAVSMVNSNYMGFGTGYIPKGFGFTLQNRGHNFSLDPDHPNCVAGGKRPFHTIIPALITHADDNSLLATISNMGGFMQVGKVYTSMISYHS